MTPLDPLQSVPADNPATPGQSPEEENHAADLGAARPTRRPAPVLPKTFSRQNFTHFNLRRPYPCYYDGENQFPP